MAFRNAVDIANRGLQILGQVRIADFNEDNERASEMMFAYDKLRRVELRSNYWKFSTRRTVLRPIDTTTMLVQPALWSSLTTYRSGALVIDEANTVWVNNYPANLNNAPGNSYYWDMYFGPLTATPYDSTIAYNTGELVYTYTGTGTYTVFMSLESANDDNPATATAYDVAVTYHRDQVVTYLTVPYISMVDLNLAQTPSTSTKWASGTTYAAAASVYGTDGYIYTSIAGSNLGNNPVTTSGFWTNTGVFIPWNDTFTGGSGAINWLQLSNMALTDWFTPYPLGAGPSTQSSSNNALRLPANFLRIAPQDPRAGSVSPMGASGNRGYDDWLIEGDFIVTSDVGPMVLRFIADIQTVPQMDDLFCEGFAARLALETCEKITQSTDKKTLAAQVYKMAIDKARLINAIENGAMEPAEDDFITCRG